MALFLLPHSKFFCIHFPGRRTLRFTKEFVYLFFHFYLILNITKQLLFLFSFCFQQDFGAQFVFIFYRSWVWIEGYINSLNSETKEKFNRMLAKRTEMRKILLEWAYKSNWFGCSKWAKTQERKLKWKNISRWL